jgi:hypothetical protein
MQAQAKVEIENRERVSRAMKENAAITARQEERNFQIQTQNSQNTLNGLAAQARRDQEQAAINQKATASIFESISSLSSTASKVVNDIQLAKKKEEFDKEFYDQDPNANAITQLLRYEKESKARIASQARLAGIQEAEAKGADPLTAAKLKENDSVTQYDFTEATVAKFFRYQYLDVRTTRLAEAQKEKGTALTYDEKKAVIAQLRQDVYDLVGAAGLSADLVKPHLEYADQLDTRFHATEQAKEKKESDERRSANHLAILNNTAPEKRQEVFNSSFPHLVDIHGFEGALNILDQQVFNVQDPKTGEFLWSPESVAQTRFPSDGRTVAEKYTDKQGRPTGRYAALLAERVKLQNEFRSRQIRTDQLSNAELEDKLARSVLENPTAENVRKAQEMYTAVALAPSTKLNFIEKHLSIPAQQRQNTIQAVSQLRDFELTPEIVAAAVEANPTDGAKIKARYEAYNAKWKSESYKDAVKSVETVVSGTTSFGTTKAAEAGALPMIGHLKAELRNRTALYEPTLGFEAAHQKAAGELANEYRNGYRDKNSKFYREVSRNGTVSYPNLPVGNVSAAEQTKRDITGLRTSVKTLGVEGVLDTPLSVTSAERLDYIKKNFYKDDFKPTPKELAFIGMTKGMPLHEAYNRFFEANGDSFRLNSPLRLNGKEVTLTPEDQKILGDPTKGPQAKLAVINRIINPGMFQSAATMRAGSPFLVYISGNIGPTSTGQHLDVKEVGGREFAPTALDEYFEVDDPELGVVPLSRVPITGDFASHTARGSHGIDYGLYEGTKIYAKNGARIISKVNTEHGCKLLTQLPNGKQYTFLHGTCPN